MTMLVLLARITYLLSVCFSSSREVAETWHLARFFFFLVKQVFSGSMQECNLCYLYCKTIIFFFLLLFLHVFLNTSVSSGFVFDIGTNEVASVNNSYGYLYYYFPHWFCPWLPIRLDNMYI